jgi:hypothetical protein
MKPQSFVNLFALLFLFQGVAAGGNIILKPLPNKNGPEKLLVLVPGGLVPNQFYVPTSEFVASI